MGGLELSLKDFHRVLAPEHFRASPAITLEHPEQIGVGNRSVAYKVKLWYNDNPAIGAMDVVALVKENGTLGSRNFVGTIKHPAFVFMPDGSRIVQHGAGTYAVLLSEHLPDYVPLSRVRIHERQQNKLLDAMIGLAYGRQAMHRKGLAYIDDKKSNVLIKKNVEDAKFIDFDATMAMISGKQSDPLRWSDTWPTLDGIAPCPVTYTIDTVAFARFLTQVLDVRTRPGSDIRKRIYAWTKDPQQPFDIDELISILEAPAKERRRFFKVGLSTAVAVGIAGYGAERAINDVEVQDNTRNHWLDQPNGDAVFEQGLASAFVKEYAAQVTAKEIPSEAAIIDAIPGRYTRHGTNLGIELFYPGGGAYTSLLFEMAKHDERIWPAALAHADALANGVNSEHAFVENSGKHLRAGFPMLAAFEKTHNPLYVQAGLRAAAYLATRAVSYIGKTIIPFERSGDQDRSTFQSADADSLRALAFGALLKDIALQQGIEMDAGALQPDYKGLAGELSSTLQLLLRDGIARSAGGISDSVHLTKQSIAANHVRLALAFLQAGKLLNDSGLEQLSNGMFDAALERTGVNIPRFFWDDGPLDARPFADLYLLAKKQQKPRSMYEPLLRTLVHGTADGLFGGVPRVELIRGFKETYVVIKRKELISGASTSDTERAWQNVGIPQMDLSFFRALTGSEDRADG